MWSALLAVLMTTLGQAQPEAAGGAALGWLRDLAGSCWKGAGASGQEPDRQCYTLQYEQFVRGTIAMPGGLEGDSIIGVSKSSGRLVMYYWSNGKPRGEYELTYEGDALVFNESASATSGVRNKWLRTPDGGFRVIRQALRDGAWVDGTTTLYRRDGAAPPPFDARLDRRQPSDRVVPGFGWFATLASGCWTARYPDGSGQDNQCYAWQYPEVLQASASVVVGGAAHQGQAVYLADPAGGVTYYHWGTGGQFGAGVGTWSGNRLSLQQRGSTSRTTWEPRPEGFAVTVERLSADQWQAGLSLTYTRE